MGILALSGCGGKKKKAALWPIALIGSGEASNGNNTTSGNSATGSGVASSGNTASGIGSTGSVAAGNGNNTADANGGSGTSGGVTGTGITMETVATPIFSPTPGHFATAQANITITTSTAGATIYYTTNGDTPTTASTVYTTGLGHIWFLAGNTLKAIAVKSGSTNSAVATAEYSYSPLKSGQTTSYAAGDDGATQLGVARSYTNNGNGTVTDNATGLLWQRCSVGQSGASCATGSASSMNYATAETTCAGLTTAGKTWRLPSVLELTNLTDYGTSSPSINVANFPATVDNPFYWSSTPYLLESSINRVYYVSFLNGSQDSSGKASLRVTRCVSGDIQTSFVKFIDSGDGTIKDKQTGLTWQKCSVGQTNDASCSGTASSLDWGTAITTCSGISLAGKTWRLPSTIELKSIVDTTVVTEPAINPILFPSTLWNMYWSSTAYAQDNTQARSVNFWNGDLHYDNKTTNNYVRCVFGP